MILDLIEKRSFHLVMDWGNKYTIFWADMSSSGHANNKTKNILVLSKDFFTRNRQYNNLCRKIVFN